jgi:putative transposase
MDADLELKAEQLAGEITAQAQTLDDLNGLFRCLMKSPLERILDTEMDLHLGRTSLPVLATDRPDATDPAAAKNRRNGHSPKTVRGELGELDLDIPRDRNGTFQPQRIPKHQRRLAGFDDKILALYAKGLTTRAIQDIVGQLYGVEGLATLIAEITADLDAEVTPWRQRRLDPVWPIVYLDGIVVHVRGDNGRVTQHTLDAALGVNRRGKKELLSPVAVRDGGRQVLAELPDGPEQPRAQRHLRRGRGRLDRLPRGDRHRLSPDEGAVVRRASGAGGAAVRDGQGPPAGGGGPEEDLPGGATERDGLPAGSAGLGAAAEQELGRFEEVWGEKYPTIVKQWRQRWADIITLFEFAAPIRKAIDTTNAIESVNRVIRKFTSNRKQYPNAESALKRVYLAIDEASKKWTMPIVGWKAALNHFAILFEDRLLARGKN